MERDEISNLIDEKEKKLREVLHNNSIITEQLLDIERKIAELELQKKTLKPAKVQANYLQKQIESDLRSLKNQYWKPR